MITSVSFSSDGKRIASSSYDKTLRLWDVQTGKEIMVLEGHNDQIIRVIFSPDDKLLASSSGTIFLWDAETGKKIYELEGHAARTALLFSPDSKTLYSASFRSDNDTIKVWDLEKKEEIMKFRERTDGTFNISLSPNGNMMALASADNSIRLRDVKKWIELKRVNGDSEFVISALFSPDGKFLASTESENSSSPKGGGNTIWLRDANTLKKIKSFNGHKKTVGNISFTPDSNFLASGSTDKSLRIWDVNTGKELIALPHTEEVFGVSFLLTAKKWHQYQEVVQYGYGILNLILISCTTPNPPPFTTPS
ncbi:MAG: WD40 repeat domain-containing protein [Candidatus Electrothrix gigas]